MGMYDYIECTAEEVRDHWDCSFQTKDLECTLCRFRLTSDGLFRLTKLQDGSWAQEELETPKRINYTGVINFYDHDADGDWIEYWALLDHGKVVWIKLKNKRKRYG